jgi:ribosomal protein S18 acetylase RimI-like enzyme
LYVHPKFQSVGVGTYLIKFVFSYFTEVEKYRLQVFAKNKRAYEFYCRLNFYYVEERLVDFGVEKVPAIVMERA